MEKPVNRRCALTRREAERDMKKVLLDRSILLIAITMLAFTIEACSDSKAKQGGQRLVPVKMGEVVQQNVPLQIGAIGNVEAYNAVSVKALVGGEVTAVHFRDGQDVKQGDLLFQIDPRPYEAALKQSEAQLARDSAQARLAEEQAKRYEILIKKGYVSRDQYEQFRANAEALAALVNADKANVENNRLQLSYCTIKSPINGRVGSVLVNRGNIVKANDVVMLTINQVNPIYVTFSVPERNLSDIKKYSALKELPVEVMIDKTDATAEKGVLTFVDNAVDPSTGTIRLKATFRNGARRLWPGQFVNVVLTLYTQKKAIVVPTQAVQSGQAGQYVYVVKSDMSTELRPVTVARTFANGTVIEKGLAPGDKVVTDGQLRIYAGAKVQIKNGDENPVVTTETTSAGKPMPVSQKGKE